MNITPPTPEVTQGPEWAEDINTILTTTIAEHNHQSPNGGVQLTQDALDIDGNLSLNGNQLTNANAIGLATETSASVSGSNRLYNEAGDLYYRDGSGTDVRITQNGSLSAASFGGISGLSGTSGTATFAGLSTFIWKKDATAYATMENGPVKVYSGNDAAPTSGIVLSSPDGLASDTTLILPNQLPADINFMLLSGSGQITASVPVTGGITNTMLAGNIEPTKVLIYSGSDGFDGDSVTGTTFVGVATVVLTTKGNNKPIFFAIQGVSGSSAIPNGSCSGGIAGTNAVFFRIAINDGASVTFHNGGANFFVGSTGTIPCTFSGIILNPPDPTSGTTINVTLQASADSGVTCLFNNTHFAVTQY